MSDQRQWIGTWHDMGGATNAALVRAETEHEAAVMVADELQALQDGSGSDETVDGVFVVPWDGRVAYRVRTEVERAELQCCGGEAPSFVSSSPHWATCPERATGTGQPRSDDEQREGEPA